MVEDKFGFPHALKQNIYIYIYVCVCARARAQHIIIKINLNYILPKTLFRNKSSQSKLELRTYAHRFMADKYLIDSFMIHEKELII